MRLTEARQGVRMLRFVDVFGRWEACELSQLEAAELLGIGGADVPPLEPPLRGGGRSRAAGPPDWQGDVQAGSGSISARKSNIYTGPATGASRRGISTSTWWEDFIGLPGATAGPRRFCKAAICYRRRRVAVRTGASGRAVRCLA